MSSPKQNFQEEEEVFEEEEEDISELDPDHSLYSGLQKKLHDNLIELRDSIDVEFRDKLALKARLSEQREQQGVELYSLQQQLSTIEGKSSALEAQIQQNDDHLRTLQGNVADQRKNLADANAALQAQKLQYETQRTELEKLNSNIIQLEKHNQGTLNEVAVVRRETYKSEQSATQTEVTKKDQDTYIDKLTRQVSSLSRGLDELESQILSQRQETKTARDALLQSSLEMEKINFERNQLMQEWNSSLIGIKLRTKTLSELETASASQEEQIQTLEHETQGLKRQIQDQEEMKDRSTQIYNKTLARIQNAHTEIGHVKGKRVELQAQLETLHKMISTEERNVSKSQIERNNAKTEFQQSLKNTNDLSNKIRVIEDLIIKHCTEQSDLKRDAGIAQEMVLKIRDLIEAKKSRINRSSE